MFDDTESDHYYLIEGGEVLEHAERYRVTFNRLKDALFEIVTSLGCTEAWLNHDMMLLRKIRFSGSPPEGWTKKDIEGGSRPRKTKSNEAMLRHFTPGGCYMVTVHPELAAFNEWLRCPTGYAYKTDDGGSGATRIGRLSNAVSIYWYHKTGPLLLVTPDVAAAKRYAASKGYIVENDALSWTPPNGLRPILREEWALMKAKYEAEQAVAEAAVTP